MCEIKTLSVDGLLLEKQRLEERISQAVGALVVHFYEKTGVGVRAVNVPFVEVTTSGDTQRQFRVGMANVSTNLT